MACRALPQPDRHPEKLRLIMTQDDQDLPSEERDTLPPSGPLSETPPAGTSTLEEIAHAEDSPAESWDGYDESKFMHRATAAIINGTNVLLKVKQTHDIEAILHRQRVLFEEAVSEKFERFTRRLDKIEKRQETGDELYGDLRLELAAVRSQLSGYDKLVARLDKLERDFAALKPGVPASEQPTRPEPHSG